MTTPSESTDGFPKVEVHVPISPTPLFCNMLKCMVLSLRRFGGRCASARVIATVGDHASNGQLRTCEQSCSGLDVEFRPTARLAFDRYSYLGTGLQRLNYSYGNADVVILADADILICGPLDDAVQFASQKQSIAGVIANTSPFGPSHNWTDLFRSIGLPSPVLKYQHHNWGFRTSDPARRLCPAYFNYGFVVAAANILKPIGQLSESMLEAAIAYLPTPLFFQAQIALSLCIAKLGLSAHALPARYNVPNEPALEEAYGPELPYLRVIHMLAKRPVHKSLLFASLEDVVAFTQRQDLGVVNRRAADVLRAIIPLMHSSTSDTTGAPGAWRRLSTSLSYGLARGLKHFRALID